MITDRNPDDSLRYEDSTGQIRLLRGVVTGYSQTVLSSTPAGGTGTAAGGWSTSGDRDTTITTITEMKTQFNSWRSALNTAGYTTVAAVAGSIPAGGVGAAAGGWDTAANRDLALANLAEIKSQFNLTMAQMRLKGQPAVADVAGALPAGGTGVAGGCYDTGGNRDTCIATIGEIKAQLNAMIVDMRNKGYIN